MKRLLLCCVLLSLASSLGAQTILFHTGDATGFPYRIPAIAQAPNGDLIALSDWRPCGEDIGYGRVDIQMRISKDQGLTWSEATNVLVGTGEGPTTGYGDACLVADRERNELTLVCCSGDIPYQQSTLSHHQGIMVTHATYDYQQGVWVWGPSKDVSPVFYQSLFANQVKGMFMSSGRICQSRFIKVGTHYRLYAALCTHLGSCVVYSDDFGDTWQVLGDAAVSGAPKGDEAKCEELPDGSVLLSSRKQGGRYFNIFRFTDVARGQGHWMEVVDSRDAEDGIANEGTPCNGEILLVDVVDVQGNPSVLALQSIPAGPKRANVTIYYKDITHPATYATPQAFASHWDGSYQVSHRGSAYSTMVQQADGRLAFFYEEEPDYYQLVYLPLTIEAITGGKYHTPHAT